MNQPTCSLKLPECGKRRDYLNPCHQCRNVICPGCAIFMSSWGKDSWQYVCLWCIVIKAHERKKQRNAVRTTG